MLRSVIFLIFIAPVFAFAGPNVIYFGGGGVKRDDRPLPFDAGQSNNKLTQFNVGLANIADFEKKTNSKTEYFYDINSENFDFATQKTGRMPELFSAKNYNERVERLIKQIESGEAKEPILLVIDTHGGMENGKFVMNTTTNLVAPVDRLKALRDVAEKKGVPLAVVFGACESGAAMSLGSDKTCVISAAKPDQLGYSTEFEELAKEMANSDNLEEAFLNSRRRVWARSQPMISTPAGQATSDAMAVLDRFIADEERAKARSLVPKCYPSADYMLARQADRIDEVSTRIAAFGIEIFSATADLDIVKKLAHEYDQLRNKAFQSSRAKTPLHFCSDDRKTVCVENLDDYYASRRGVQAVVLDKKLPKQQAQFFKKLDSDMKIFEETSAFKEAEKNAAKRKLAVDMYAHEMFEKSSEIAKYERRLYKKVYELKSKELAGKPNPCAAFKLK